LAAIFVKYTRSPEVIAITNSNSKHTSFFGFFLCPFLNYSL
jgi:hypothetical protein